MSVPDFQTMMLPFLQFSEDQKEHALKEVKMFLIDYYNLSNEDIEELVPSGQQTRLDNRISWISTFFKKAKIIEQTKRGFYKTTVRGIQLLKQNPNRIDMKVLQQFPEFVEFRTSKNNKIKKVQVEEVISEQIITPEESLEIAYQTIRSALATEIIEKIKSCSPVFFERLVVELLVKMGYGGTLQEAGKAIGKSGDGGIDGIINEDRLGLDVIYLQAKRWEGNVSRPEIQKFAGALQGRRARKGVFITTSDFTKEAREYVKMIDSKIILIDGEELADLMIDYSVGVSIAILYEIKKIDSDYFSED
ncbi:MAG TPA: restriction endonuclease [Pyrinomonadaceae bacterium]|jgi:restriction system protein